MARTIVVFEKRPRWTPELQRQFSGDDVVVRSCRSTADVSSFLESVSEGVVVLDIEAGKAECLQFLGRLVGRVPLASVIAITSRRTAALEWPLRELGALAVLAGPVGGEDVAALCRRAAADQGKRKKEKGKRLKEKMGTADYRSNFFLFPFYFFLFFILHPFILST